MIILPNTGGKQAYADSTGKQIVVGNKLKFRGQIYTLKGFGPDDSYLKVATLLFEEPIHTDEVPTEISVDLVS